MPPREDVYDLATARFLQECIDVALAAALKVRSERTPQQLELDIARAVIQGRDQGFMDRESLVDFALRSLPMLRHKRALH